MAQGTRGRDWLWVEARGRPAQDLRTVHVQEPRPADYSKAADMNRPTGTDPSTGVMPIRVYGEEVLRGRAEPVEAVTPEVRELAQRMVATMVHDQGIGLAAPQVGRPLRLITLATCEPGSALPPDASPGERLLCPRMPLALVNPRVLTASESCSGFEEGCLSIPEVHGVVVRPDRVLLHASTLSGEIVQVECGGLLARCLQHEIDHLNGILFVDHLSEEAHSQVSTKLGSLAKQAARAARKREKRSRSR